MRLVSWAISLTAWLRLPLVNRGLERRIIYTVSIEDMGNQSDNQAIDRQV
ncbi:hypothetical protein COO91_09709 (plasmid) [Nostoc flagelliforme CCNUN1]|uniref:Uncharacterized protein n=1 Tax=Nostoc flagelliforme CCNUN1 TaxID=2038116 RepID=A0A2K8T753_9NOSO|nr:hypothetical protein COO91_09709 [Nostoc flagelliforme CCNUN1]